MRFFNAIARFFNDSFKAYNEACREGLVHADHLTIDF